jgi:hypothetical protein
LTKQGMPDKLSNRSMVARQFFLEFVWRPV